jgi:hypothetical protein
MTAEAIETKFRTVVEAIAGVQLNSELAIFVV